MYVIYILESYLIILIPKDVFAVNKMKTLSMNMPEARVYCADGYITLVTIYARV